MRLMGEPDLIKCDVEKAAGLVLWTVFLKKGWYAPSERAGFRPLPIVFENTHFE
ncbi:MAG TPA: hypothetical protein PLO16_08665 [Acidocella sp.]|nr:hypothetical protein [Acidocella sp.]